MDQKNWRESIKKIWYGSWESEFVIWHCKDDFESGKACVDGVCG